MNICAYKDCVNKVDALNGSKFYGVASFLSLLSQTDIKSMNTNDIANIFDMILDMRCGVDIFVNIGGHIDMNDLLISRIDSIISYFGYGDRIALLQLGYYHDSYESGIYTSEIYYYTGKSPVCKLGMDELFVNFMFNRYYLEKCLIKYPQFLGECISYVRKNSMLRKSITEILNNTNMEDIHDKLIAISPHGIQWITQATYSHFEEIILSKYDEMKTLYTNPPQNKLLDITIISS